MDCKVFEDIYAQNRWMYGSGGGSLAKHTKAYRALLQRLLQKLRITTVVDMGCGDWQFSRLIDWNGIKYKGFDVVGPVIEKNHRNFSSDQVSFHYYSGEPSDLPAADLLIVKDVLQHWSDQSIRTFIPIIQRYKYCLITNCVNPRGETIHGDIEDGGYRYLDLRLPPFNVKAEEQLTYSIYMSFFERLMLRPRWKKTVLLITNA